MIFSHLQQLDKAKKMADKETTSYINFVWYSPHLFQYGQSLVPIAREISPVESKRILVLNRSFEDLVVVWQHLNELYHGIVVLPIRGTLFVIANTLLTQHPKPGT